LYIKKWNTTGFRPCLSWIAWVKGDYLQAIQEIDEVLQVSKDIERGWREEDLDLTKKNLGEEPFQMLGQKGYALAPEQVMIFAARS
jgi:hypothetical protein